MAAPLDYLSAPPPDPALVEEEIQTFRNDVDHMYEDALRPLPDRIARWRENMAFLRGFQHTVPVSWSGDMWGSVDIRQEFEVENHVAPIVYQYASKIMQAFPQNPDVVSPHDGVLARARADASGRLARSFPRNGVMPIDEVFTALIASATYGGAYMQVYWDQMAGPRPRGQDGRRIAIGDVRARAVTLLDVMPDPTSRNEYEDRHVFHRQAMPMSQAMETWPTDILGEKPVFMQYGSRAGEGFSALLRDDRAFFQSSAATKPNQIVEVVWYWEKPTTTYPEGRVLVYSGTSVLDIQLALPSGIWPWIWIPGPNAAPGVRIPDGLVHNLKGPQRSLNFALSKIRENATLCTNPAMLAAHGSGVSTEKLDDLPGTVVNYNAGVAKPEWMNVPGIPQGLFQMNSEHREAMSTISSFSDVAGGTPQGDLSGRAILNLEQINTQAHGPQIALVSQAFLRLQKACLQLAHDRYDEGRLVAMYGENNRWTTVAWKNGDFEPDIEIVIDPFSQKPTSSVAKFARAVEIANLQGFADTPDARRFRQAAGADSEDSSALELDAAHKRRAKQEDIQLLLNGVIPAPLFEDNDDVHLECHELTLLGDEVQNNPNLVQVLRGHISLHEQNGVMKAGAMQGQPGQPMPVLGGETSAGGPPPPPATPQSVSPMDGGAPQQMDSGRDVGEAIGQGIAPGTRGTSNAGPGG